jgi:hypothetical protein
MNLEFLPLKRFTKDFEAFKTSSASEIMDVTNFLTRERSRRQEENKELIDEYVDGYLEQFRTILVKRMVRGVRHDPAVVKQAELAAQAWVHTHIVSASLETKVAAGMWSESFYQKALEKAFLESQDVKESLVNSVEEAS